MKILNKKRKRKKRIIQFNGQRKINLIFKIYGKKNNITKISINLLNTFQTKSNYNKHKNREIYE
jgi:hypothetical protein